MYCCCRKLLEIRDSVNCQNCPWNSWSVMSWKLEVTCYGQCASFVLSQICPDGDCECQCWCHCQWKFFWESVLLEDYWRKRHQDVGKHHHDYVDFHHNNKGSYHWPHSQALASYHQMNWNWPTLYQRTPVSGHCDSFPGDLFRWQVH